MPIQVLPSDFLADVQVKHGPPATLGRYMLLAAKLLRNEGITLSFGKAGDIDEIHGKNIGSWQKLYTGFDCRLNALSDENFFCYVGRDRDGDVLCTQAARLYDWSQTDCLEEMTSLRLWYADPERSALPGEKATVSAIVTKAIRGRVGYSGGTWIHPKLRGRGLARVLPRLSRATIYALWGPDVTFGLMEKSLVEGGLLSANGFLNMEWSATFEGTRMGTFDVAVLWMKQAEVAADLERIMQHYSGEVAQVAAVRRA